MPKIASADFFSGFFNGVSGGTIPVANQLPTIIDSLNAIGRQLSELSVLWNNTSSIDLLAIVLTRSATALSQACFYIATLSSNLLRYILNEFIGNNNLSITRYPAFLAAWDVVKSYANMLIVLGLIASAALLILKIKEDINPRKLIVDIIIAALLINFSVVFCGVMIDASNILMRTLTVGAEESSSLVLKINASWDTIVWPTEEFAETAFNKATTYFALNLIFDALYIMVALAMFYFIFIVVQRYIMLAILFILGPLAFVLRVFPLPAAKSAWNKWWDEFLKYCILGVEAAFFLMLAGTILGTFTWQTPGQAPTEELVNLTVHLAIVIGFLIFGLRIATKSAGPIAAFVMGAAVAITAAIVSGGSSLMATAGTAALKKTGAYDEAKRAKGMAQDAYSRSKEALGIAPMGTTEMAQKKRNEESLKGHSERLEASDNTRLAQIATTANTAEERASATNILAKRNALGSIANKADREQAMKNAMAHGISIKDFVKGDPTLAKYDKNAINKLKETNSGKLTETAEEYNERMASLAVQEAAEKAQPHQAKDWTGETLGDANVQMGLDLAKIKAIIRGGNKKAKDAIKEAFSTSMGRQKIEDALDNAGYRIGSPERKKRTEEINKVKKYIITEIRAKRL